ncbi:MAG: serine/threonine-protein kinase, partial [Planctomycetota bacterium]
MPTIFEPGADDAGQTWEKSRLQSWVDSNIGATIAAKYEVVRCLGTGGMGGVFLAKHCLLPGSFFALKLIIPRPHSGPPDEQEKRFTREARTAMKFVHPRAAQVRDFGFDHDRGVMYMAMDYLEGRRLDQVLADAVASNSPGKAVIDPARALRITYLILDALKAAHAADVIHRDLKPGNVILVGSGAAEDVRILDFGCAKIVSAANRREPVELPGERTRYLT